MLSKRTRGDRRVADMGRSAKGRLAPGAAIPLLFAEGYRCDPIAFSGQPEGPYFISQLRVAVWTGHACDTRPKAAHAVFFDLCRRARLVGACAYLPAPLRWGRFIWALNETLLAIG